MSNKTIKRLARSFIPLLAINIPLASLMPSPMAEKPPVKTEAMIIREERAGKIDGYFAERSMPLKGYGLKLVVAAERNDFDWRLLPAIAIRESSGGKNACGQNPFGWGSCKIDFDTLEEAIEVVAWNLGANNPATAKYYRGDMPSKLKNYNGGVVRRYPQQVLKIMERIEKVEAET
ncbi:MAG: hypothetical protein Q8R12_03515 [bacterium]|nr:hypothetical protein [bacterium]